VDGQCAFPILVSGVEPQDVVVIVDEYGRRIIGTISNKNGSRRSFFRQNVRGNTLCHSPHLEGSPIVVEVLCKDAMWHMSAPVFSGPAVVGEASTIRHLGMQDVDPACTHCHVQSKWEICRQWITH